jgi:hypothetical protein
MMAVPPARDGSAAATSTRCVQSPSNTLNDTTRLRIATRIHFALRRHFDADVAVGTLLKRGGESREALWVCEASGDAELMDLARQYTRAMRAEERASAVSSEAAQKAAATADAAGANAPQDTAWSKDTSGFGVSRPPGSTDAAPAPGAGASWLNPANWLRRGNPR